MHRTTIMLPPDLRRKADREARKLGISLAELIRRRLEQGDSQSTEKRANFFSREPWQGAGPADTAANHDEYLYGP